MAILDGRTKDTTIRERRFWPFFGVLDIAVLVGLMIRFSRRWELKLPSFRRRTGVSRDT